jgi:hypothetical protein
MPRTNGQQSASPLVDSPSVTAKDFAEARARSGFTPAMAALLLGVSASTVYRWEWSEGLLPLYGRNRDYVIAFIAVTRDPTQAKALRETAMKQGIRAAFRILLQALPS